ncbi:hypothetical protein CRENBAI_003027 [Crenichthys baileyi]|uniref:Secreted protein n=1 Tax=Crenichthys baileyi TaxID=28760 RepID=A0AAV9RVU0_9TELE
MFLLHYFCCFLKVSTQEVGHREEEDMQHRSLGWASEQGQLRTKGSVYGLWRYTTTPRSEPCLGLLGFHVLHVGVPTRPAHPHSHLTADPEAPPLSPFFVCSTLTLIG